jgi:hypothetical protein
MEFSEVIDSSTLTESFAEQLIARELTFAWAVSLPLPPRVTSEGDPEPPTPLDIFNLRDASHWRLPHLHRKFPQNPRQQS